MPLKLQAMKRITIITTILLLCFIVASAAWYLSKIGFSRSTAKNHHATSTAPDSRLMKKLEQHADDALSFAKQHNYNTRICFLVDMSIESGKNRFFVYDTKQDSLIESGLVDHGCCY